MKHLVLYWYVESFGKIYGAYLRTLEHLEGQIAVRDTARNISKPLFQDYTYQGRFIGVLLRLSRIVVGIFLYSLIMAVYLLAYLIWLLFPFICLASIFGSLLATPPTIELTPLL